MPFHTHISTPTGASIALWHLTETEAALAALLGDEAYRQLSSQGLSPKRFCEQAATRLLLDRLDETRGGVMAHTTEGQPYLTDRPGHLSISHTRQWVAIAWHPTQPVGIDIERLGARVERVAARVFNENELQAHNRFALLAQPVAAPVLVGQGGTLQGDARGWGGLSHTTARHSTRHNRPRRALYRRREPHIGPRPLHPVVCHPRRVGDGLRHSLTVIRL